MGQKLRQPTTTLVAAMQQIADWLKKLGMSDGQIDSELFDINYSTSRIRPWDERRRQAVRAATPLSLD